MPRAAPPPGGERPAEPQPRAGGWEPSSEPRPAPPPSPPRVRLPPRPRRPAPTTRRLLPGAGDGEVPALSPKACVRESARVHAQQPCPRPGFAPTPQASKHPSATHSPPHPPTPSASVSILLQLSRERFPRALRLPPAPPPPKGQAPSSPPSATAAPALGSGSGGAGLWGRLGPRGS